MQTPLDPAIKKAYEVSYALFRVAAIMRSKGFAELLEKEALNLLRSVVANSASEAQSALGATHYMVSFGRDTNNMHSENAEVILRQLESLADLLQHQAKVTAAPADLGQVFSTVEPKSTEPKVARAREPEALSERKPLPQAELAVARFAEDTAIPLKDRQTMILDKIRQSGNCRTRDIQAVLPDLSERTLRYDLQKLVEEGKIERMGSGPASVYRIKEGGAQSNISGGVSL